MFSGSLNGQNNNASGFISATIVQGTLSVVSTTYTQPETIYIGGVTPLTYTWSRVSGYTTTIVSGQGTATCSFRDTTSVVTSTLIQCVTTYSGGSITTYDTIYWGPAV